MRQDSSENSGCASKSGWQSNAALHSKAGSARTSRPHTPIPNQAAGVIVVVCQAEIVEEHDWNREEKFKTPVDRKKAFR